MHFLKSKVFSPVICFLGFGVWVTPGGHTCVKSLPQVGVEVYAKFGGDGWLVRV